MMGAIIQNISKMFEGRLIVNPSKKEGGMAEIQQKPVAKVDPLNPWGFSESVDLITP